MSESFTAADFAQAGLATRGESGVARRAEPRLTHQWRAYGEGHGWFSDEEMAADGWVPVVEATEVMQNRQIDAEAHLDQIERLSKRASAAEDQIESQRLALDDLREENDRLERILQAPLSLRDLEVAWEAAEEADECRKGDVLIRQDDYEVYGDSAGYAVYPATVDGPLALARILSRAPKREPWADLADVLGDFAIHDHDGKEYPDVLARLLHVRGVRVTGGEES